MRSFPVIALGGVLLLAACGQEQEPAPAIPVEPAQVQEPLPQEPPDDTMYADGETRAGGQCDPTALGSVNLAITGNPGDGFRLIKMCGTTEVARCYAAVAPGQTGANCADGPNPQPAGDMRCVLGPQNGNSATATAVAWTCS